MQSLTTDFKRFKAYPRRQEHWTAVSNPARQMDTNYIFFVLRFKAVLAKKTCICGTPDYGKHITQCNKSEYRNVQHYFDLCEFKVHK
jgi:hypothetical protein